MGGVTKSDIEWRFTFEKSALKVEFQKRLFGFPVGPAWRFNLELFCFLVCFCEALSCRTPRRKFQFSIVKMPYKDSNMPEAIFYSSIVGEILRIGRSSLLLNDFILNANELIKRMIKQGGKKNRICKFLQKLFENHPETFNKYASTTSTIINLIFE